MLFSKLHGYHFCLLGLEGLGFSVLLISALAFTFKTSALNPVLYTYYIPTLGPRYILYTYMDPLGKKHNPVLASEDRNQLGMQSQNLGHCLNS